MILRGKHKPIFAPHMDVGDNLIIINAAKVVLTGGKETKKVAWRHSGHPGGITGTLYEDLLAKRPAFAVEKAVRGMLPKNRLGRAMIKKLHVVPGPEHHHQAQKPVDWAMGMRPAWEGLPAPGDGAGEREEEDVGEEGGRRGRPTSRRPSTPTANQEARPRRSLPRPRRKSTTARKPTAAKTTATRRRRPPRRREDRRRPRSRRPAQEDRGEEACRQVDDEEEGDVVAATLTKLTTGRRKAAIARVRLVPGTGEFRINDRSLDEYFPTRVHRMVAQSPLRSDRPRQGVRRRRHDHRRWRQRSGGRAPARHRSRAPRARPGAPSAAEGRGVPAARRAGEGAAQVRAEEGSEGAAVLEALVGGGSTRAPPRRRLLAGRPARAIRLPMRR